MSPEYSLGIRASGGGLRLPGPGVQGCPGSWTCFLCCRCRSSRSWLRRISTSHYKPHHYIRLNAECRADIEWWCTFHRLWNGRAIIRSSGALPPDVILCTDASGTWGCGAYWATRWFQVPWDGLPIMEQAIAAKELFPIVMARFCGGHPRQVVELRLHVVYTHATMQPRRSISQTGGVEIGPPTHSTGIYIRVV